MPFAHFLFLPLILLLTHSCRSDKKQQEPPPAVDVVAFTVTQKTIPVVYSFVGFAESSHLVEIRARVEGYLDKIAFDEGQMVSKGDLLFQLDPKQYEAKVEIAKGEVARQAALLENAKLTVNRLKPLYEQKAASKKDLDNAIATLLSTEASLQSAKAQLLDAEINLGYTTITSPITGMIDRSRVREGALINPSANTLLTTVSILDPIWVYFSISENEVIKSQQQLQEEQIIFPIPEHVISVPKQNAWSVEAVLSDGTVYPLKGVLDFNSPSYNQSTGTLLARAVFSNPNVALRPGQFLRIKLYGAKRPNAMFVPLRALMQKKEGMFVYLIQEDHTIIAQDISLGDWYGEYQIVTNGLKPGDRIVMDGINKVLPGMRVNVIDNRE